MAAFSCALVLPASCALFSSISYNEAAQHGGDQIRRQLFDTGSCEAFDFYGCYVAVVQGRCLEEFVRLVQSELTCGTSSQAGRFEYRELTGSRLDT